MSPRKSQSVVSRKGERLMSLDELRRAATLLRTLADVELADALGDSREVGRLLAGVDPVETRRLANSLTRDTAIRSLHRLERMLDDVLVMPGRRSVW